MFPTFPNISQHHPCQDMQGHRVRWIMPGQDLRMLEGPQSNEAKTQCRRLTGLWKVSMPNYTISNNQKSCAKILNHGNAMQCWYLCLTTPSTSKINNSSEFARHGKALDALPLTLGCAWARRGVRPGKPMEDSIPSRTLTWNQGLWRWCLAAWWPALKRSPWKQRI